MSNVNAYCTIEEIKSKIPFVLRGAGRPQAQLTDSYIEEECVEISAEMDTRFGAAGITIPINTETNERLRRNLSRIATNGVCATILKSLPNAENRYLQLSEGFERQYYMDISSIEKNGLGTEDSTKPAGAPTFKSAPFRSAFAPLTPGNNNPTTWGRW